MKQRFKLTKDSARFFEFMKKLGLKCEIILTNYTAEIITENNNFKHIKDEKSTNVFIMAKKIIADINNSQLELGFDSIPPDLTAQKVNFYRVGNMNSDHPNVYCIDIKNAYPTVLFNHGFIKEKTHNEMLSLKKEDRLAAIGFLASKKHHFEIDEGRIENFYIVKSEYERYFYFCAERIDSAMHDLSLIVGESFIFSWVDCIYISGDVDREKIKEVTTALEKMRYKYTVEVGKEFKIEQGDKVFNVSFRNEKDKLKIFRFPKNSSDFLKAITDAVMNGKFFTK